MLKHKQKMIKYPNFSAWLCRSENSKSKSLKKKKSNRQCIINLKANNVNYSNKFVWKFLKAMDIIACNGKAETETQVDLIMQKRNKLSKNLEAKLRNIQTIENFWK